MINTLKYITITTLILLLIPIAAALSGWQWEPVNMSSNIKLVLWITESATYPWVIFTNIFLFGYFSLCLKSRPYSILLLLVFLASITLIGQSVKSLLKNRIQSLRPYDVWIEKNYSSKIHKYHNQQYVESQEELYKILSHNKNISPHLMHHWFSSSKFSCPSGHTLFVATWALLGAGLLWSRRCYFSILFLLIWAIAVMGSRLLLGMHWPKDLLAAIMLSWLIVTLAIFLLHHARTLLLSGINKQKRNKSITRDF
ncbi:phosphatase PAP2 family protein [Candidatus Erwinia haradaeae]|uniref:undecaprenyl-diphosphate phosphatase n=1 Tax=Candidatus Erwinia haradaeae TaxID=1922217 RepID=A0A451DMS2_9GAMM|nr:phosphatase PAP2 family protein [Candidatus Erwinia haradaeae]VFP88071.1 Phosphatidylglycerophosphatase B [Candidatus Erwinia haradaeae]